MKVSFKKSVMLLALLMLVQNGLAFSAICKWTDESGRVHYSDLPQSECHGKQLKIEPAPTEEQAQETRDRVQKLIDQQKASDKQKVLEEFRQYEREREANRPKTRQEKRCRALEFKLETLGNKKIDVYSEFSGGPRETTSREREAMRKGVEDQIKKYCK